MLDVCIILRNRTLLRTRENILCDDSPVYRDIAKYYIFSHLAGSSLELGIRSVRRVKRDKRGDRLFADRATPDVLLSYYLYFIDTRTRFINDCASHQLSLYDLFIEN
ncbi:hypothetical protein V1477_005829 [Vespula maculifrons]|uniref:Uncharacterized protein n=1 Tax=Vespula maculifrons TaxID=7453 RepID=A0ABD2CLG6_VESMC